MLQFLLKHCIYTDFLPRLILDAESAINRCRSFGYNNALRPATISNNSYNL